MTTPQYIELLTEHGQSGFYDKAESLAEMDSIDEVLTYGFPKLSKKFTRPEGWEDMPELERVITLLGWCKNQSGHGIVNLELLAHEDVQFTIRRVVIRFFDYLNGFGK